jgi:8-oxo-dGTP pyrophosphatase MutT (NUDIX family)
MKDSVPAWSVVVVAFDGPANVLAISRGFNPRDPAFPGGDSEAEDESPASTAKRELFEETGLTAMELRCMDQWTGDRGQPVFAFFVPRWRGPRLRTGAEGKPFWSRPERLLVKTATFRDTAQRLLAKLGRVKPAA